MKTHSESDSDEDDDQSLCVECGQIKSRIETCFNKIDLVYFIV